MQAFLPPLMAVNEAVDTNVVRALVTPSESVVADASDFRQARAIGYSISWNRDAPLLLTNGAQAPEEFAYIDTNEQPRE